MLPACYESYDEWKYTCKDELRRKYMKPKVIKEINGDKVVYEWDGFYLRDDLDIRQGGGFEGWEQAYSLFMRDSDGYHREGVYAIRDGQPIGEQFNWVLSQAEAKIKELRNAI